MKGPEDETVLAQDNGNDPLGLVYRWPAEHITGAASLLHLSFQQLMVLLTAILIAQERGQCCSP